MTPASHSKSGIVFLVHGTRNVEAGRQIHESMQDLCPRFAQTVELTPEAVRYSFLECMAPLLTSVLEDLCREGKTELRILPLLLFPGTHLFTDIPDIARQVMDRFPGVRINVGGHIGVAEPEFLDILMKRL